MAVSTAAGRRIASQKDVSADLAHEQRLPGTGEGVRTYRVVTFSTTERAISSASVD